MGVPTPEQAAALMRDIAANGDEEGAHCDGDEAMCNLLRELGYGEMVDIWVAMPKWFA